MVAKVYGRFAPRSDERDRWELIATAQDAERESDRALYQALYQPNAAKKEKPRNPLGSRDLGNSRGGTRTRDPGIMSAVL